MHRAPMRSVCPLLVHYLTEGLAEALGVGHLLNRVLLGLLTNDRVLDVWFVVDTRVGVGRVEN